MRLLNICLCTFIWSAAFAQQKAEIKTYADLVEFYKTSDFTFSKIITVPTVQTKYYRSKHIATVKINPYGDQTLYVILEKLQAAGKLKQPFECYPQGNGAICYQLEKTEEIKRVSRNLQVYALDLTKGDPSVPEHYILKTRGVAGIVIDSEAFRSALHEGIRFLQLDEKEDLGIEKVMVFAEMRTPTIIDSASVTDPSSLQETDETAEKVIGCAVQQMGEVRSILMNQTVNTVFRALGIERARPDVFVQDGTQVVTSIGENKKITDAPLPSPRFSAADETIRLPARYTEENGCQVTTLQMVIEEIKNHPELDEVLSNIKPASI